MTEIPGQADDAGDSVTPFIRNRSSSTAAVLPPSLDMHGAEVQDLVENAPCRSALPQVDQEQNEMNSNLLVDLTDTLQPQFAGAVVDGVANVNSAGTEETIVALAGEEDSDDLPATRIGSAGHSKWEADSPLPSRASATIRTKSEKLILDSASETAAEQSSAAAQNGQKPSVLKNGDASRCRSESPPPVRRKESKGSLRFDDSSLSGNTRDEEASPRLLEEYQFHLLQAQKLQYTSSVLRDTSAMDQTLAAWKKNRQRNTKIFMASRPLVSALNKWWFQLVLLLFFGLQAYRVTKATLSLGGKGLVSRRFRFLALETRGERGSAEPHISEFGLLWDGCPIRTNRTVQVDGTGVVVAFEKEVRTNGFYVITADGEPDRDPVGFRVERWDEKEAADGEDEAESAWSVVGTPTFRYGRNGKIWLDEDSRYGFPTTREEMVRFDLSHRLHWLLGWFLSDTSLAVGFLAAMLVAKFGRELHAFRIFQLTFALAACLRLSACVAAVSESEAKEAVWWALMGVGDVLVAAAVELRGRFFLLAMVAVGTHHCLVQQVLSRWLFGDLPPWPIFGAMTLLMGIVFLAMRQRMRRRAQRTVEMDRFEYHKVWVAAEAESDALYALKVLIDRAFVSSKAARQYNPKHPALGHEPPRRSRRLSSSSRDKDSRPEPFRPRRLSLDSTALHPGVGGKAMHLAKQMSKKILARPPAAVTGRELNYRSPVTSLGQLYCQARGVDVLLRNKVEDWGLRSDGWARLNQAADAHAAPEFVRWRDVIANPKAQEMVAWATIKPADRAIQKLLQSYKGEVSRLLDVCRQRIVFASVQSLTICLRRILDDDGVVVCRIRNYLDHSHPDALSGGFRAVIVNLRVCSPEAMAAGLDTHVCELQLVTTPFAVLQTPERHARYIKFRNDLPDRFQRFLVPLGLNRIFLHPAVRTAHHSSSAANVDTRDSGLNWGRSFLLNAGTILTRIGSKQQLAQQPEWISEGDQHVPHAPRRLMNPALIGEPRERQLFEDFFRQSCSTAAGSLQKRIAVIDSAVQHASSTSVAFTSKAASAILSKRKWQILIAVVATLYLWRSVQTGLEINTHSYVGDQFRFQSLANRRGDGRTPPHLAEFGLLWNGCPLQRMDDAARLEDDQGVVVVFEKEVEMNGFYFVTARESPELDPVRFIVEARSGVDAEWKTVGASAWRIQASAGVRYLDWHFHTPEDRLAFVSRSPRAHWPWIVVNTVVQIVTILFLYTLVVIGMVGQSRRANEILSAAFGSIGFLQIVGAVGFLVCSEDVEFVYWMLFSISNIFMSILMARAEKYLVIGMACCGAYLILLDTVYTAVMLKAMSNLILSPPLTGIGFFLVGIVALLARMRLLSQSTSLIGEDKQQYDLRWEQLMAENGAQTQVKQLARLIKRVQPKSDVLARQYLHAEKIHITAQGSSWHLAGMAPDASAATPVGKGNSRQVAPSPAPMEAALSAEEQDDTQDVVVPVEDDVPPVSEEVAQEVEANALPPLPQRRAISTPCVHPDSPPSLATKYTPVDAMSSAGGIPGRGQRREMMEQPDDGLVEMAVRGPEEEEEEEEDTQRLQSPTSSRKLPSVLRSKLNSLTGASAARSHSEPIGTVSSEAEAEGEAHDAAKSRWMGVRGSIALRIYRSFSRNAQDDDEEDKAGNALVNDPLTNLDQLYTQAKGADVLLKDKVKEWALKADGLFPAQVAAEDPVRSIFGGEGSSTAKVQRKAPEFIKWSDAVADPAKQRAVKWGKIKTVDRAIEKLLRSYKADVSRLLDVCRQSIVFDTILDLKRCLEFIRQDPDIKIVRIKNRMDLEYDSTMSAGYRDVVLNIRVTSKRAVHLRIDTHVCELQLILRAFASMKHDQGHKRYKLFRDSRGE